MSFICGFAYCSLYVYMVEANHLVPLINICQWVYSYALLVFAKYYFFEGVGWGEDNSCATHLVEKVMIIRNEEVSAMTSKRKDD